ncbi:hypothetical protein [Salinisphaera aquimarina]|uniref:Sel1 repeat family protein n=1 Tax=Salinisphaera aquimarina TaxID=2094031 RepID=A0ABV7ET34_9GAMM
MLKTLSLPILAGIALGLSGCGLIYKPTGQVLAHYSQDEVVPYVLGSGDLDLSTCGTGMGQGQLLSSFSRVISRPSKVLLTTSLLAGLCSEAAAQEADLRFQRALRAGDTATARDARTEAQRLYRRTALRRLQAYNDTVSAFGELGDDKCPSLGSDAEEVEHLGGTLTSVQALLSDIQASSSVGVPQDVAAKAGRETQCMDNEKLWGVPNALQAVVWLSVPGTAPEGVDPWTQLKEAADYGASKGMPLAAMLYAVAGYGQSDEAREKEGIRQVAKIYSDGVEPKDYLMLGEVAYSQALFLSDRIWTRETGKRTPFLALGDFPGDDSGSSSDADFDADDFLN